MNQSVPAKLGILNRFLNVVERLGPNFYKNCLLVADPNFYKNCLLVADPEFPTFTKIVY